MTTPAAWQVGAGFRRLLSRFSASSALLLDRKTQESDWASRLNVWSNPGTSANELAYHSSFRSRVFFNRANPAYGFDVGYRQSLSRQLLTGGWEARHKKQWQLNTRNNLTAAWALLVLAETGDTEAAGDVFTGRNYRIRHRLLRPQLQWTPLRWLRISSSMRYVLRQAAPPTENTRSYLTEYELEWQANHALQSTLSGFVKIINLRYNGTTAGPLGYEMLEALRPGANYTWRLQWQQRLRNGLRMQLHYDGRMSPEQPIVHFGGVQITALF